MLNDDEDEKWNQIERERVVNDSRGRKMSLNKAITEGLSKEEQNLIERNRF